jgi:amino acid transporter
VAPIEVLATIQYASTWSFAHHWFKANGTLSGSGIAIAAVLMVVFVIVNVIGIRWLANVNTAVTTWKVAIPILAIVVLLLTHFHSSNFSAGGGFFVGSGSAIPKSIMEAIASGGIVFALLGFEQAVQLGGESANPQRDLPRAVIGSILIGACIYTLVQLAFIGALSPSAIASAHTWANLANNTQLTAAPFYTVAKVAGVAWLAWVLRLDAVISPGGTGLIYLTSTSRLSFSLSKNGYVPTVFEKTSKKSQVPVIGIVISAIIGMLFLLPFPAWGKLVGIVTAASVLMYAGAPLALGALRKSKPELPRAYKLPAAEILAPLSFVLATWIVYWSGWQVYSTLVVAVVVGYALMALSAALKLNPNAPTIDWQAAWWIIPYLVGIGIISYFGQFGAGGIIGGVGPFKTVMVGGNGDIPFWVDLVVVSIFSLAIYYLAMMWRMPPEKVDQYVREVYPPVAEGH